MPRAAPAPLSDPRMDVVQAAWHKVAAGGDEVTIAALKDAYDASRHPRVLDGNMAAGQAKEIVGRHFDGCADGVVRWDDFLQYHVRMSNEVDRGRTIDRDSTFVNIVVMMWKLDKDPEQAMQPTGIIPATLECPPGLKRTKNMDLVWHDPSRNDGSFLAFRGVVKTRFARRELPPAVRGHFVFSEEINDATVRQCPSRSSTMFPLSIVWEENGRARGFREVVSPNVDIAALPASLKALIVNHSEAEKLFGGVEWLALEEPYNPMYKKSSESFGESAYDSAQDVLTLKKKVWDGTNCGMSWHGHTGKFTDSFNGGPYKFSGLNTAVRR